MRLGVPELIVILAILWLPWLTLRAAPLEGWRRPSTWLVHLGGMLATDLQEVSEDLRVLDGSGRWAVVVTFEGKVYCARFARWRSGDVPDTGTWTGPGAADWSTSLDRAGYVNAVREVRGRIAAGTVYQVNVCRVMSAPLQRRNGGADLLPLARGVSHQARDLARTCPLRDAAGLG